MIPSPSNRVVAKAVVLLATGLAFLIILTIATVLYMLPVSTSTSTLEVLLGITEVGGWCLVGPFLAARGVIRICGFHWMEEETRHETERVRKMAELAVGVLSILASLPAFQAGRWIGGGIHVIAGVTLLVIGWRRK